MRPIDVILPRLKKYSKVGPDKWMACCPAHDDRNPSMSVTEKSNGKVLVFCHSQKCSFKSIANAIGLEEKDFDLEEPKRNGPTGQKTLGTIVNTYEYQDESGTVLYRINRYVPKNFRAERPDGHGGWIPDVKGVRPVLYRLPKVITADEVFLVEGEKDADALERLGFIATTKAFGSNKWLDEFSETLRGRTVYFWPDRDEAGVKYANSVLRSLRGVASKVYRIDTLIGKQGDAHDFITHHGRNAYSAVAELKQSCAEAQELEENPESPTIEEEPETSIVTRPNGVWEEYLGGDNEPEPTRVETKPAHPWPEMEDGSIICTMAIEPAIEIVKGLLTEQTKFMIASSAKSFKTWLTLYMAVAIAHGIPFLGRPTLRKRVVYFNLELRPVAFKRRVQIVTKALGIASLDPEWFYLQSLRGRLGCNPIALTIDLMIDRIKEVKAEVAVIDPVYKLNTEGEENSTRDQTRLFNQIDRLTTEGPCAVIICDHFSKGSQADKDPLDAIRGSSAKGGDVDAALVLRKHDSDGCYSSHFVLRELPPVPPVVLEFAFPLHQICADLDPEDMKRPSTGRKKGTSDRNLLECIKDSTKENPVSNLEWAERAGLSLTTLKSYLPGLRSQRFTETVGEGTLGRKYISAKGLDFLAQFTPNQYVN